jgi:HSP20 family protein
VIRFRYPTANALHDALEQLLEQPAATSRHSDTPIPVDVYREGSEIVVEAALSGVQLDDIELSAEAGLLTIHAQIPITDRDYAVHERPSGSLSRILKLPDECEIEEARASLRDGVLRITLPRPTAAVSHAIRVEIATDAGQPSTIVMEKTPQVVDAVKGKDYRDITSGPQSRRKRS